jgi:hypothetical protein
MGKEVSASVILLVTGNTRVGGAQRILLDEFYEIQSRGLTAQIISLSPSLSEDDILIVDSNFRPSSEVVIKQPRGNRISQVYYLAKVLRKNQISGIVSHDFPGVVICRVASFLSCRNTPISLYIHQLMDMSSVSQRQKRILMSLFASRIYVSSFQFKTSWEEYLGNSKFWRIVFRKKIKFDRMGIFPARVQNLTYSKILPCAEDIPHLIFMSRITAWKGFSDFKDFAMTYANEQLHTLLLTTKHNRPEIFSEKGFVNGYNHVIYGSGVSSIKFPEGCVHFYPSNYGDNVKFPQSIGMNVLEFIAVGVPSMISHDSFNSWPELRNSMLVRVVDWKNMQEVHSVWTELNTLNALNVQAEVQRLIPIISISGHVDQIIRDLKD